MESALRGPVPHDLKVIETLGWYPGAGAARLDAHMARAETTCVTFGFAFDRGEVDAALADLQSDIALRVRMTWGADGFHLAAMPKGGSPDVWTVAIHGDRLSSGDAWLRVKTTQRRLYDLARASLPEGVHEWLFLNEKGHLCEGTITNVFVRLGDDLVTPPLQEGVLPGILRAELIAEGKAVESVIDERALKAASDIYVGNSLRGLIPAKLAG